MYFDVNALDLFAADEIERARRYHRPLYLALGVDLALRLALLAVIAFGPPGDWLWGLTSGAWWARTLELTGLVLRGRRARPAAALGLARLVLRAALGLLDPVAAAAGSGTVVKGLAIGVAITGLGAGRADRRRPRLAGLVAARRRTGAPRS